MSNPFAQDVKKKAKVLADDMMLDFDHLPLSQQTKIKEGLKVVSAVLGTHNPLDVRQTIFGIVPSKSNCYRIVTIPCKAPKKPFSSLAKTKELREYERSFGLQCTRYRNAGIQTDFRFEMDVYYPSKRADLDNSLKCVLDCLQPQTKTRPFSVGAISNDNLCQEIILRRHVDAGNPRIEFVITPLNS
jgi:Holliday junction resolvase RusA-like endonuclease